MSISAEPSEYCCRAWGSCEVSKGSALLQVTTLSTNASVLGVALPKGRYDPRKSLAHNTGLSEALLSRFDLVLLLQDTLNPEWDSVVSEHILAGHQNSAPAASQAEVCSDSQVRSWHHIDGQECHSYVLYVLAWVKIVHAVCLCSLQ